MAEFAKIERPAVGEFAGKRKLYCVPNVYLFEGAPGEYIALVNRYWDEVTAQIERLEAAGRVGKIFCESVYSGGDEAIEAVRRMSERAAGLVRKKTEEGAALVPVEDMELFSSFLDWRNCLHVVRTEQVFRKVYDFYLEAFTKRLDHVLAAIENNLAAEEAGLLIMADEERAKLQFPKDIEIFLVTPPAFDDLMRFLREKLRGTGLPGEG